jgi:hypothetical protein
MLHAGFISPAVVQAIFRKTKPVQALGLPYTQFRSALQEAAGLVGAQLQDLVYLLGEAARHISDESPPVMVTSPGHAPAHSWDDTTTPAKSKAVRQSKAASSSLPPILSVLSPPDPPAMGEMVRKRQAIYCAALFLVVLFSHVLYLLPCCRVGP